MKPNLIRRLYRKLAGLVFRKEKKKPGRRFTYIPGTDHLIVEFIGPPGVGKSTYVQGLIEALNHNYTTRTVHEQDLDDREQLQENAREYHVDLLQQRILHITEEYSDHIYMLDRIQHKHKKVLEDIRTRSIDGCVIRDEGLFHHFSPQFQKLRDNPALIAETLKDRLIIHVTGHPEAIYRQILERKEKSGVLWEGHNRSAKEIHRFNSKVLEEKRELARFVRSHGGDVLDVDISDGIEANVQYICNEVSRRLDG